MHVKRTKLFPLLTQSCHRASRYWLTRLGDASFSIYLSNLFTLAICTKVIRAAEMFPTLGVLGTKAVLAGCALALGLLFGLLVERPLNSFLLGPFKKKQAVLLPLVAADARSVA